MAYGSRPRALPLQQPRYRERLRAAAHALNITPMKLRTILLGLCAFLLALVVVLPVSWVAKLLPAQVQCAGWRGSIWNGQCSGLRLALSGTTPVKLETL